MSLKIDRAELEIVIKNDESRKRMREIEDDMRNIRKEMKKLDESSPEFKSKLADLKKAQTEYDGLIDKIGITGLSMKELRKRQQELNAIIAQLPGNSPLYDKYKKQLDEVNGRLKDLRGTASQTESSLSNLANGFNKYFNLGISIIAGITGASMAFRKLAEDVAHMDDVYADVMKTTNLTKEQVMALNEELKKMDTRTSREDLNKLAEEAGKLGIEGTKNIMDFVDAGNQIKVSLGEDLGEDAIKNIGKMVGVFQKSTKELQGIGLKEQMLAVGSAVNQLGASSSASEDYLVQFAGRLGGVATQAGIGMDAILGFGSALDQDMQQVEMSATAMQQFIMKIMGDPAKFAKLAGLNVKEFSKLLNTDANSAIKQVLRSLNEKGGFQALIPIFQEMGLDGARATGVLSSMANSIGKIDEAQKIANKSMSEGTSITNEYNIKNNNLAAQLDKAKKQFTETALKLGESLNPILLKSTNLTTYLIRALVELPKWLKENSGTLISLTLAITGYTIAINASIVADKLKAFWTEKIIANTKKLWITLSENPYAAIAAAMLVVVGIFVDYYRKIDKARESMNKYNEQSTQEIITANQLFEAYKKTNSGTAERGRIMDEIKTKYGDYLKGMIDEKGNLIDIERAQTAVNNALRQNIAMKLKESDMQALSKEYEDLGTRMATIADIVANQLGSDKAAKAMENINNIFTKNGSNYKKSADETKNYLVKIGVDVVQAYGINADYIAGTLDTYWRRMQEFDKGVKDINTRWSGVISNLKTDDDKPAGPKEGDKQQFNGVWCTYKGGKWVPDKPVTTTGTGDPNKEKLAELDRQLLKEQVILKQSAKSKEETDTEMLALDVKYITKKRDLYKKDSAEWLEYESKLLDIDRNKKITANEADLKAIQDSYKAILDVTDIYENEKRDELQRNLDDGTITQEEYNKEIAALDVTLAERRLQSAKDYQELISSATFNSEEDKKKAVEAAKTAVTAANAELIKANKVVIKNKLDEEKEHLKKVADLRKELGLDKEKLSYAEGLKALKAKLKESEASEKESADAIAKYRAGKYTEYAESAVQITSGISNIVSSIHQAETDKLEVQKNKELAIAGNNASQREKIEKKYAQKELDLKKKQADANMGIAIAQSLAEGALGIAKIWATDGINPILAGILTAILVGVTAANISSAVSQRNAIKSQTLGYSSGGFTGDGREDEPAGTVHRGEFVASAKGVRNPHVRKFLDVFNASQMNGTISMINTTQILEKVKFNGYKNGGYVNDLEGFSTSDKVLAINPIAASLNIMDKLNDVIQVLNEHLDNGIPAYTVISGKKGSYEMTKKYEKYIKNASR